MWTDGREEAFGKLKKALRLPFVILFRDFGRPFVVETHASSLEVTAMHLQKNKDEQGYPVQFSSQTMRASEKKYLSCEREALALVFGLLKVTHVFAAYSVVSQVD